jgi:hypothetical protein
LERRKEIISREKKGNNKTGEKESILGIGEKKGNIV